MFSVLCVQMEEAVKQCYVFADENHSQAVLYLQTEATMKQCVVFADRSHSETVCCICRQKPQ